MSDDNTLGQQEIASLQGAKGKCGWILERKEEPTGDETGNMGRGLTMRDPTFLRFVFTLEQRNHGWDLRA